MEELLASILGMGIITGIVLLFATVVLPLVIWYYLGLISTRLRHIKEILNDLRTFEISKKG